MITTLYIVIGLSALIQSFIPTNPYIHMCVYIDDRAINVLLLHRVEQLMRRWWRILVSQYITDCTHKTRKQINKIKINMLLPQLNLCGECFK